MAGKASRDVVDLPNYEGKEFHIPISPCFASIRAMDKYSKRMGLKDAAVRVALDTGLSVEDCLLVLRSYSNISLERLARGHVLMLPVGLRIQMTRDATGYIRPRLRINNTFRALLRKHLPSKDKMPETGRVRALRPTSPPEHVELERQRYRLMRKLKEINPHMLELYGLRDRKASGGYLSEDEYIAKLTQKWIPPEAVRRASKGRHLPRPASKSAPTQEDQDES